MTVITGRTFGLRRGYESPREDVPYDAHRAALDAQYLQVVAPVLDIALKNVRAASEELSVTIAAIREREKTCSSNVIHDLHDVFAELLRGSGAWQSNVRHYAKLVIEIEDRMRNAQQYIVEHTERTK